MGDNGEVKNAMGNVNVITDGPKENDQNHFLRIIHISVSSFMENIESKFTQIFAPFRCWPAFNWGFTKFVKIYYESATDWKK